MQMKTRLLVLPVAAIAAVGGCMVTGGGPTETRDHSFSGFDRIAAGSGIDVVLNQGPFGVKSEAPEGKLDRIVIEQSGNELKVDLKSEIVWLGSSGRYLVTVSAPAFTAITASGGADVNASALQADSLSLSASGGADIDIKGARIGVLEASAGGGGDIEIAGTCTSATLTASGGGDFDGEAFDCDSVTARAEGGGDIDVGARMTANGTASGGGDVRFLGSPTTFLKDESPGGDVSVEAR
jgi:hypothetical protein